MRHEFELFIYCCSYLKLCLNIYQMKLSGCSSEILLTYVQVAKANTALSVANFNAALAVPAALGLDPSVARSHSVLSSNKNFINSF